MEKHAAAAIAAAVTEIINANDVREALSRLFDALQAQDMNTDSGSDNCEDKPDVPDFNEDKGYRQRCPQKNQSRDPGPSGHGLVINIIADIEAEDPMTQEPVVKASRAADIAERGQQ